MLQEHASLVARYLTAEQCMQLDWCVKDYGQLEYIPSLAGNALYLALFCLGLLAQIGLGIRYRTWGYMIAMFGGIGLEIVGYVARIELHNNIFNNNYFIIYLVGLTIGPAFFSAAIYLSLGRILAIYGDGLCLIKPKTITIMFIGFDFLSLVLQAAGGAMASLANTHSALWTGIDIMIAGLSTQVASTTAFCLVCVQVAWAIRRHPEKVNEEHRTFRSTLKFRLYILAIAIATIVILIRCTFRVAELSGGFHGALANNEAEFMVLDGAMMLICIICLTAAHPGIALGELWNLGVFHWRTKRTAASDNERDASSRSWAQRSLRRTKQAEAGQREKFGSPPSSIEGTETA